MGSRSARTHPTRLHLSRRRSMTGRAIAPRTRENVHEILTAHFASDLDKTARVLSRARSAKSTFYSAVRSRLRTIQKVLTADFRFRILGQIENATNVRTYICGAKKCRDKTQESPGANHHLSTSIGRQRQNARELGHPS